MCVFFFFFWGGGGGGCGYLGVITNLDHLWGSFLFIFGSALKVKVQNGNIFGFAKF